ncbi:MAG: acylphosphatase [Candidatus Taylorbacteria bacterium]|nr:acylphosphatase [Candidatus Taylorbacteria bacterium]
MKRLECVVSGRVQGVMYRDFAKRKALSLGLKGTVENLVDGNVMVVVEGEEKELQHYLFFIKKGSFFSKVRNVKDEWLDPQRKFSDFKIIYRNFFDRI